MKDEQRSFETVSLPLAASILTLAPGSQFSYIAPEPSVDGRRLIVLTYPADQAQAVHDIGERFHNRQLTVPLYPFNQKLNFLRDHLLQRERSHAVR